MKGNIYRKILAVLLITVMFFGTFGDVSTFADELNTSCTTSEVLSTGLEINTNNVFYPTDSFWYDQEGESLNPSFNANENQLSPEAEYVADVANWFTTQAGVVDNLSDYSDSELITFIVWLQELPLALKEVYEEEGLIVEGYAEAENLSANARATINAMAVGGGSSRNSVDSGSLTINGEFFGIFAGFSITTTKSVADVIAGLPGVHAVSVETMFYNDPVEVVFDYYPDPNYTTPGNLEGRQVNGITDLHAVKIDGRGVKVGVIDDGIDKTHPDLSNYVAGYNFAAKSTNVDVSKNYHGTHVSGTIGSQGIYSLGVAPGVALYNGMVFAEGSSSASQSNVMAALEVFSGYMPQGDFPGLANQNIPKMDVVNMSLGVQFNTSEYGSGQFERNNAVIAGVVIVNSAGNDAFPNGNSTHRNNYSMGSGTTALAISVAASQYGGQAFISYDAKVNGNAFDIIIENTDVRSTDVYKENMFGITEPKYNVYFGPPRTNAEPNNIWLTAPYINKYYDLYPLEYEGGKGYKIYYACTTTGDMTEAELNDLKGLEPYSLKGMILVVNRGQSFTDYLGEALRLGAGALIILNRDATFIGNVVIGRVPSDEMPVFTGTMNCRQTLLDAFEANGEAYLDPGVISSQHLTKEPADFSSIGPGNESGQIKPDIIAPGYHILSTKPGNEYQLLNGTSMSSPYVAGVAALIIQHLNDEGIEWTPADIKARMMATANPLLLSPYSGRLNNSNGYFNPLGTEISVMEQGAGFVDVKRSVYEGVYFLIENMYPTGNNYGNTWATGQLSSFSFGVVPRNGEMTLSAEVFGLNDFTVLEVKYNQDTRYSNKNQNNDVTVTAVKNGSKKVDVTIHVGNNAADTRASGNIYEGYVVIEGDNGKTYYIPWATRVEGWMSGDPRLVDSISVPQPRGSKTPKTDFETTEYYGTIEWSPSDEKLQFDTDYVATVSVTTKYSTLFFTMDGNETQVQAPGSSYIDIISISDHNMVFDVFYNLGADPGSASVIVVSKTGLSTILYSHAFLLDSTCTASAILDSGSGVSLFLNYDEYVPFDLKETGDLFHTDAYNYNIPAGTYDWAWFMSSIIPTLGAGFAAHNSSGTPVTLESGEIYIVELYFGGRVVWNKVDEESIDEIMTNYDNLPVIGGHWKVTINGYFLSDVSYDLYCDTEIIDSGVIPGDSRVSRTIEFKIPLNDTGVDQVYKIDFPEYGVEKELVVRGEFPGYAHITAIDKTGGDNQNVLLFDYTLSFNTSNYDLLNSFQQWIPSNYYDDFNTDLIDCSFSETGEGDILAGSYVWLWMSGLHNIVDYNSGSQPLTLEGGKSYLFEYFGLNDVRITLMEEHLTSISASHASMPMQGGEWKITASGYFSHDLDYTVYKEGESEPFATGFLMGNGSEKTAVISIPPNSTGADQYYTVKVPYLESFPNYKPKTLKVRNNDTGYASVTLTVGKPVMFVQHKYVLLFDSQNRPLANVEANYDYTIPANLFTNRNALFDVSQTIQIPEGVYAVYGFSWLDNDNWDQDTLKYNDYYFEADAFYHFEKYVYGTWIVTKSYCLHKSSVISIELSIPATCEDDGLEVLVCSNCGEVMVETVKKALGHDWVFDKTVPPSGTDEGYDLYVCSRCGEEDHRTIKQTRNPRIDSFVVNRTAMPKEGGTWIATATGYLPNDISCEIYRDGNRIATGTMQGDESKQTVDITIPANTTAIDQVYTIVLSDFVGSKNYEPQTLVVKNVNSEIGSMVLIVDDTPEAGAGVQFLIDTQTSLSEDYAEYDYLVPDDASNGTSVVYNESQQIDVPAGTYQITYGLRKDNNWLGDLNVLRNQLIKAGSLTTYKWSNGTFKYISDGCRHDIEYWIRSEDDSTPATCEDDGLEVWICSRIVFRTFTCDEVTEEKVIDALGHDWVFVETVPPSGSDDGYDLYVCSRCGEEERGDNLPPETVTISINKTPEMGGTVTGGGTMVVGTDVSVEAFASTGYDFDGWYVDGVKVSGDNPYTFKAERNISLEAKFTLKLDKYTVTVTADPELGGTVSGGGTFDENTPVTVTATVNTGYVFDGWYENGTKVSNNREYNFILTANRTLVAKFTLIPDKYTVTVISDPEIGGTVNGEGTFDENTLVTVFAEENYGYVFAGWYEGSVKVSDNRAYNFMLTANRTLIAKFKEEVTITLLTDGDGIVIGAGTYVEGDTVVVEAIPANGYVFDGWYEDGFIVHGANRAYSFIAEYDRVLTAMFKEADEEDEFVNISVITGEGGEVFGGGRYKLGETVALIAKTNPGYLFDGWYVDDRMSWSDEIWKFEAEDDLTIYAVWTSINQYTVYFETNDGTPVYPITVTEGGIILKSPTTVRSGFIFKGWYTDPDFSIPFEFGSYGTRVYSDMSLYAKWEAEVVNHIVQFVSNGGSYVPMQAVLDGDAIFRPEDPIKNGYDFGGWYMNDSLTVLYDFDQPVTSNLILYAGWTEIDTPTTYYTVTFEANGGTPSHPSVTIDAGTSFGQYIPWATRPYYTFLGWNTSPYGGGAIFTDTTIVNSNMTVYAMWQYNGQPNDPPYEPKTSDPTPAPTPTPTSAPTSSQTTSQNIYVNGIGVNYTLTNGIVTLPINKNTEIISKATDKVYVDLSKITNATSAEIPRSALKAFNDEGLNVEIALPQGTVTFSHTAMANIIGHTNSGSITVTVKAVEPSSLTPAQKATVGNSPVYDLAVYNGTERISNFGGPVEVSLPYELKPGEDPNSVVIYYVDGNGNLQTVPNCRYENGRMIFTTTHFSLYMIAYNPVTFSDISGHWASGSITQAGSRKLVSGYADGTFKPDAYLTRAEFAQLLYNALGVGFSNTTGYAVYSDVTSDQWFYNAIGAAKQAGLLGGIAYSDGTFRPNEPITRQEMADVLSKLAVTRKVKSDVSFAITSFKDYNEIALNSRYAVELAIRTGFLNADGMGDGNFQPSGFTTRAQATVIQMTILRILGRVD